MIQKYASMVGLDEKTGIEVTESEPKVCDTAPVPSAIGQGTHNYANVQLARYATTLATSGTVYRLTLLDRVTDISGNEITVALGNNNDSAGVIDAVREGDRGCVYAVTPSIRTAVQKKLGDLAEKA